MMMVRIVEEIPIRAIQTIEKFSFGIFEGLTSLRNFERNSCAQYVSFANQSSGTVRFPTASSKAA